MIVCSEKKTADQVKQCRGLGSEDRRSSQDSVCFPNTSIFILWSTSAGSSRERRRGVPRKIKSMGTREDTLERSAVEEMSAVEEERSSRREQERPVQSRRRAALG
jgi:hypothetical protein